MDPDETGRLVAKKLVAIFSTCVNVIIGMSSNILHDNTGHNFVNQNLSMQLKSVEISSLLFMQMHQNPRKSKQIFYFNSILDSPKN